MKNIILNESQIKLLAESLSSKVYHFTSAKSLFKILKNNEMFCQSALGGTADDLHDKYKFYISFSRTRNAKEGFGSNYAKNGSARIELDGNKLNHNFKGGPVNYWGASELNNKWKYHRYAIGLLDYYAYRPLTDNDVVDDEVVNKNKVPSFPTSKSPKFINVNDTIFIKYHAYGEHDKSIGYKYVKTDLNADNAPDGTVKLEKDFKLRYPSNTSPEYVIYDGTVYHKERSISNDLQTHVDNEIEDRLFTNKHIINNIRDYIIRCDVLVTDFDKLSDEYKRIIYNLVLLFGNIVHIYKNADDYAIQNNNTINNDILDIEDAFGKYRKHFADDESSSYEVTESLKDFFGMMQPLYFNDKQKFNAFVSKTLNEFRLEKYIHEIIKKLYYSSSYINCANNLSSELHGLSKSPNKEGMQVLNMVATIFRRFGFKNITDVINHIKKEYDIINGRLEKYVDCHIKKPITILKIGYSKYDVTNMSETDFWYLIGCRNFNDRKDIVRSILYNMDDDMVSHTRNSDMSKFEKYLLHLAHNRIDFMTMNNLFKKLGFEDFIRDVIGYNWSIKVEYLDYFDYLYGNDINPAFDIGKKSIRKFMQTKALEYFKK